MTDELDARGWTQKRLAEELHCSEGAVTGMLAEGAGSSRLVDQVNAILRLAPPEYIDDIDRRDHETLRRLRALDRDAYDRAVQRMERDVLSANDNADEGPENS